MVTSAEIDEKSGNVANIYGIQMKLILKYNDDFFQSTLSSDFWDTADTVIRMNELIDSFYGLSTFCR